MALSVSTGDIFLKSVAIENTLSVTGKVELKNVIATQSFNIHNGTGDVEFEGCDAGDIFVNVSTGDITGTLISGKSFITSTNTGRIDVPNNLTGGRCEIHTTTGDINIQIKN